jgi:membrane protein required for beta-lactamase induction
MLSQNEKKMYAALSTLLAELAIVSTHYGSELHKAKRQAEKTLREANTREEKQTHIEMQNVTIGVTGKTEKQCYSKLCEALHAIGAEWTTDTYINEKGIEKSTRELWPNFKVKA